MRLGSAILIILILLSSSLLVLINGPIATALRDREKQQFYAYGAAAASEAGAYLTQSIQLAEQLPSRTQIRAELVNYLTGERSRDWYLRFAQPRLGDAVEAAPGLLGVLRHTPDGTPLVNVSLSAAELPRVTTTAREPLIYPDTLQVDGESALLIQVPIEAPEFGLAGYDLVALSLEPLTRRLSAASSRFARMNLFMLSSSPEVDILASYPDGSARLLEESGFEISESRLLELSDSQGSEETLLLGEAYQIAAYRLEDSWFLLAASQHRLLFEASGEEVFLYSLTVALLGLFAALASALFLSRIARRNVADKAELDRIIGEQTHNLQLLLREVHHRVKNDLALMNSFVSLKRSQVTDPEAKNALADVGRALSVTRGIYERLQEAEEYGVVPLRPMLTNLIRDAGPDSSRPAPKSEIAEVAVERDTAIPLGIMVNELLTNAGKHGDRQARTTVRLERLGADGLLLEVTSDRGTIGDEALGGEYGFGLSMVKTLAEQFSGKLTLSNDPTARVTVEMPRARVMRSEGPGAGEE